MPSSTTPPLTHLGIDIAKLTLELSPHPALSKRRSYPNTAAGHRLLITALRQLQAPVQIICEATGGYERPLIAALHHASVPVTLLNPRQARDFARARGLLAKTDTLDAALLADYGRTLQPAPTTPRSQTRQRLAALVARRQELLTLITQEQNRAEHHDEPFVRKQALRLCSLLKRHLQELEAQIESLQRADTLLDEHVTRLCSVQGIGARTAWMLLAALPELGSMRRGQAAALAGLAPFNHDSGPRRGQRHIAHGRPQARQALYMAALVAARFNPILRPFYQRLIAIGKPPKLALTALMRKLAELANLLLKQPAFTLASQAP